MGEDCTAEIADKDLWEHITCPENRVKSYAGESIGADNLGVDCPLCGGWDGSKCPIILPEGHYCNEETALKLAKSLGYKTGGFADGCGYAFSGPQPTYSAGLYVISPTYSGAVNMRNCAFFGHGDGDMNAYISDVSFR